MLPVMVVELRSIRHLNELGWNKGGVCENKSWSDRVRLGNGGWTGALRACCRSRCR